MGVEKDIGGLAERFQDKSARGRGQTSEMFWD